MSCRALHRRPGARPVLAPRCRPPGTPIASLLGLLCLLATTPAPAADFEFTSSNDFLTKNPINDDLYTFGFSFKFAYKGYLVGLREEAFTDQDNHLRFDETYLTVGRSLPRLQEWEPRVEAGILHVGQGLFGEDFQNRIHRLISDDEVSVPYIEESALFAVLRVQLVREIPLADYVSFRSRVEGFAAPGFNAYAVASVEAFWRPWSKVSLVTQLGGRYSRPTYGPLKPWVAESGLVWEAGVLLFDQVYVAWNYNHYGTQLQHFVFQYRWMPQGRNRSRG